MTRNDTTSYREKGRAVFLAAIMLLSVVAVSTAFVGGAAATEPSDDVGSFDALGDEIRYEGQSFNITDGTFSNNSQVYLAEVDGTSDSGAVTSFGTVIPYDNSTKVAGSFNVEDLDFDGISSGTYVISNTSSYSSSSELSDTFSVQAQSFNVDFDDDSVTGEDTTTIELDSPNRPTTTGYNVTISAEGLDADQLDDLFNVTNNPGYQVEEPDHLPLNHLDYDDGDGLSEMRDDGYLTLNLKNISDQGLGDLSGKDLTAHFDALDDGEGLPDAGEYEFEVIVTDSGATATDSIDISESNEAASFTSGTYQIAAGDIAEYEFTLEDTDEAWLQIGDSSSDFVDVLYVKADDEDEPVTVQVNTRLLGTSTTLDGEDVYDVDNADTVESAYHDANGGAMTNTPSGVTVFEDDGDTTNGNQLDEYVSDLGIADSASEQLTRPLQPTTYEIQIAGTDVDNALFDADAGDGEANDQLDTSVLELQAPQIGEVTVHTAPEGSADDDTEIADLVSAATPREEVALDDRAIIQVEATGLYGALVAGAEDDAANSVNFDRLEDGVSTQVLYNVLETTNESINFEITAESKTGNKDPLEVDLQSGDSDSYILIDNENGQFFVVVDTSSDSAFANGDAPDSDTSFTAELEYDADNEDKRYEFASSSNPDPFGAASDAVNYPYLLQGNTLSSSAELTLSPAEVSFDNVNVDDVLEAENTEASEISGTTNVAPGSSATIRVSSTDAASSFRIGQTVNISEDGSIAGEFDLSGQEVGDLFDTTFRVGGSSIDTAESVIVEQTTQPPEDDTAEDDSEDESEDDSTDDSSEETDDESTADDTSDDSSEETDDESPGFGALVALVAMIGAALLAARRQN